FYITCFFFFSSRRRHTRFSRDWSSDVCSSDLTFGISDIHYYLLTEPVYTDITGNTEETVVREGRVIAERPKIVTPYYLVNLFQRSEERRVGNESSFQGWREAVYLSQLAMGTLQ